MRTYVVVIIGALILAGVGGWSASTLVWGKSHSATSAVTQVDILQTMSTAKDLPSPRYDLY
jgi:hypothetical protein